MKGVTLALKDGKREKGFHSGQASKVTGYFRSENILMGSVNPNIPGTCQASATVWCKFALDGEYENNPHDVAWDQVLELNGKLNGHRNEKPMGWDDPQVAMTQMENLLGWCGMGGVPITEIGTNHKATLEEVYTDTKPALIWGGGHMFVTCKKALNCYYFYDNNIGLASCEGFDALYSWVKWGCGNQDEWETTWLCLRCFPGVFI